MKWMITLVLSLSCIGGVVCAGNSTSSINKANDQVLLEKLIEACEEYNINEAEDIINNIKNLNCQTSDGKTALMIVSHYGYAKIVEMLLQYGVDANMQASNGGTALMLAAEEGYEEIVRVLLNYKVDANKFLNADGATALILAAQNGYEKVVEVLLQYGADVNIQSSNGATALMLAAEEGYEEIVRVLLDYKVDANKFFTANKATALMIAAQNGHEKIVEMLLKYGVGANVQAKNWATALMFAVQNGHEKIVEMLLKYDVDTNVQREDGVTALMFAVQNGHEKIVEMLLKYGVGANVQRKDGVAALILAVGKGNKEIAELLICYDADTELKLKESNHTAFDMLDNLSDYGISLEDEKIQYLKYILNGARVLDKVGLNCALTEYPQAKKMLVKRVLMRINKVYKEDLAIRDINDQQAQSNALLISNLLRVKKAKLSFIQDNYMPILDRVYEDEYFKQQSIEAGNFAEYKSKKHVFKHLLKAIKNQRFSDLDICTQDNF